MKGRPKKPKWKKKIEDIEDHELWMRVQFGSAARLLGLLETHFLPEAVDPSAPHDTEPIVEERTTYETMEDFQHDCAAAIQFNDHVFFEQIARDIKYLKRRQKEFDPEGTVFLLGVYRCTKEGIPITSSNVQKAISYCTEYLKEKGAPTSLDPRSIPRIAKRLNIKITKDKVGRKKNSDRK